MKRAIVVALCVLCVPLWAQTTYRGGTGTGTATDTTSLSARINLKQDKASFADSARANGIGAAAFVKNQTLYAGSADSVFSRWDTCAIFSFGLGSGGAGDTSAMVANADCGGFFNGPDSIVVTKLHVVMRGDAGDTVRVNVVWSDTMGAVAPTALNTTPLGVKNITVGVTDVAFDNNTIPPNKQVYGLLSTVVAGSKPSLLRFTLIGYRKR